MDAGNTIGLLGAFLGIGFIRLSIFGDFPIPILVIITHTDKLTD